MLVSYYLNVVIDRSVLVSYYLNVVIDRSVLVFYYLNVVIDRSVLVLRREDLICICSIKVASKLVNAVRVQPRLSGSSRNLIAIGGNEHQVKIVDLSSINPSLNG